MVSIKTVAVLGGSGNLGPAIITELLSAGFSVTGITREGSTTTNSTAAAAAAHKFPDAVTVKSVDYGSFDALKAAFANQDAVVSVVGTAAIGAQQVAIDAAVAAGVKRFIPSEFGIHTRKVRGTPIGKILAGKIAVVDSLQAIVKETEGFSWTGLSTGLFFDWGLHFSGLGVINLKDKTATVIDSGDEKWQASTLAQVGRAVAGILKHPDETANKYLATASFNLSQNELIQLVEELTGSKWPVTRVASADLQKAGEEKLAAGDYRAFVDFLRAHNSADGAGNGLPEEESANKLIGLPYEDLRASVEAWLKLEGAL
ncbi:hypothetical protein C8A00DRAFT_32984 [Chaetomidium leptoderma]|uniref:NmrA-like domain-containing protein n=1 Tax=Chaetomidium leptoderma TaxID=669021 RepID=A0AAN6VMT1_9PEZI|nr:hypothetical protein C8A00DRAFT_32984 [Chaetomidium leptoderma]